MGFIETLIVAIAFLLLIAHLINQIYLFQIKEYRFDRLKVLIRDVGVFPFLYNWEIRVPGLKRSRNIAILIFGGFITTLLSQIIPINIWGGLVLLLGGPLLAFLINSLGVYLTGIPVTIHRSRLIRKAQEAMKYSQATVIGITGSYGKSTTKDYLYHILNSMYTTSRTDRNQNTDVGVALSVLHSLKLDTNYFVVEMGAYKEGEIRAITRIVHPQIGVITAIGNQHLALFGDKESLVSAKCELAIALPKQGILFVGSRIPTVHKTYIKKKALCEVREFESVPHDPHQSAINAATAVATYVGMPYTDIQLAIEKLQKPNHMKVRIHHKGYAFIDSSYSSSVEAFLAHLQMLKAVHKPKKIVVTNGIIELGKEKRSSYAQIMSMLPPHTQLFTTDKMFKHIAENTKTYDVFYESNQNTLFKLVEHSLSSDSAILIEGRFKDELVSRIVY